MGTGGSPVTVRAATLAGGKNNQDRYAYGDGWAFVLDGASSFAAVQPEHDGGWYAERLKNALVHELTSNADHATTDIVAKAIEVASSAHVDPDTCPTSTIALARWSAKEVGVYVLGDSTAVLISEDGEQECTDSRLADIAPGVRAQYQSRLAEGHGFDERHRELLGELQLGQASARNQPGGYWIAGSEPKAAQHNQSLRLPSASVDAVVLATDGAASTLRYELVASWTAFTVSDPHQLLRAAHEAEESDPLGTCWPRSKPHDDKTAVTIGFRPGGRVTTSPDLDLTTRTSPRRPRNRAV